MLKIIKKVFIISLILLIQFLVVIYKILSKFWKKNSTDIKEFVKTYKSMEYMMCCRFHAKIISVALGQKMYILSYSKKIDNVIQDLSLAEKYTNIENLEENTYINLNDFKEVDKEKISQIKEESKNQLLKIDEWYLDIK